MSCHDETTALNSRCEDEWCEMNILYFVKFFVSVTFCSLVATCMHEDLEWLKPSMCHCHSLQGQM